MFQIMVFEILQHRQHRPQSGQQRGSGVRALAFHLATAEADQRIFEFGCGGAGVRLQMPDGHAGHRRYQHAAEDRRTGFLQPVLQLLAVRLEQFEIAFDPPAPVVAASQLLGGEQRRGSVRQQMPSGQLVTVVIADLHNGVSI